MKKYDSAVQLIDTHCHVIHMIDKSSIQAFSNNEIQEIRKILHQAALKNVTHMIEIGTTRIDSALALEIAKLFEQVSAVVGMHPHEAQRDYHKDLDYIKKLLASHNQKIVGVGECGLDKHYPGYNITAQIDLFKAHIELALEYNKALVVHTRDAQDETYAVLEQYKQDLTRVVIHCYSNDLQFAQAVTSWGWFLGIGGTITYPKNNLLRDIVKTIGIEHIVLETDAPFLPPQTIRGKKNSPDHTSTIAEFVAHITDRSLEHVALVSTRNAKKLFNLEQLA
ncbi:MAG: TatD family hydrolase [Candidatus Babeliaceae bacterium]|nr:TatD family hydrolase [Candidatus Babeliaceae bacterium]